MKIKNVDTVVVCNDPGDSMHWCIFIQWLAKHLHEMHLDSAGLIVIEDGTPFPWEHHLIAGLDQQSTVLLVNTNQGSQFLLSEAFWALQAKGVKLVELIEFCFSADVVHRFEQVAREVQ